MSLESLPPELLEPIVLLSRNPGPLSASCRALHNLFSSDSLKAKIFLWMAHDARKAQKKELQTPASTASLSSGKRTKEQAVPVPVISKFDFAGTPLELSALFVAVGFPACKFTTLSALDRVVALRKGKRSRVRIIRPKIGSDVELGIPRWLAASEDEGAVPFMLHLIRERGFEPTRDALVAAVSELSIWGPFSRRLYGSDSPYVLDSQNQATNPTSTFSSNTMAALHPISSSHSLYSLQSPCWISCSRYIKAAGRRWPQP